MACYYLEEDGYRKICKAKGILPPTVTELRLYCYTYYTRCPVLKKFVEKSANQGLALLEEKQFENEKPFIMETDKEQGLY